MIFNLTNPYDIPKFEERAKTLLERGAVVELTEKRMKSCAQNRYLHLLINFFGAKKGYTAEQVKVDFYKRAANKDIFEVSGTLGKRLRSTIELSSEEMSTSIERFRNWATSDPQSGLDVYLPSADEHNYLLYAEQVIEQNKQFL